MADNVFTGAALAMGPDIRIARVRWTPSGSSAQTLTEAFGVTGVARTGAGAWTISLADTNLKDCECLVSYIENDTTVRHQVRVESMSLSAGTIAVSHKVVTFAAEQAACTATCYIPDVSAASSTGYTVAPISGTITAIKGVLKGAISGADSVVTTYIGTTPITNGTFTVAYSGSAAGDIDSATPTAANTVTAGQLLKAVSDGGSTDSQVEEVQFLIQGSGNAPAGSDTVDQMIAVIFYRMID